MNDISVKTTKSRMYLQRQAQEKKNRERVESKRLVLHYSSAGGAILVSEGGMLEVDRCEFRTNIARSQGGAIAVEGSALLVDSAFIANYAFGSGGAVHVGFNAPGRPPSPPTLTIKNCDFLDNVGKNGGGHAVHYGKSSARQGQQYDNQLQLSSAG
jgi:predicted outer membrane repeat protein